jgi:hypothetical protein
MKGDVRSLCAWPLLMLAIATGIGSAVFFVAFVGGEDKALAWASLVLYVVASLMVAVCSWRIWFEGAA